MASSYVHVNDYLSKKNQHERDLNISFEAGPHIYTINNEKDKNNQAIFLSLFFSTNYQGLELQ